MDRPVCICRRASRALHLVAVELYCCFGMGGDYLDRDLALVALGGRVIFIGVARGSETTIDIRKLMNRRARVGGSLLRPRSLTFKREVAEALEERVWPLISAGQIRPVVHRSFGLQQANDAIAFLEERRQIGKVILQIEG